jgi:hypothetical protein
MVNIVNESSRLTISFVLYSDDNKPISMYLNPSERKTIETSKSTMVLQVSENRPNGEVIWNGYVPTSFDSDVSIIISPENKSVCLNEGLERRIIPKVYTSKNSNFSSTGGALSKSYLWILLVIIVLISILFIVFKNKKIIH